MPFAEFDQIARWIDGLHDSDPRHRARSGLRIYLAGVDVFMPLLTRWVGDLSFREMTLPFSRVPAEQKKNGPSTITIGIAVNPGTFEKICAANGSPRMADVPADQDAKEFELEIDERVTLDVLTSREAGGSGAIARYLQKFGQGIQQIELYVRDVDHATEILKSTFALQPIYPATRSGADRTRVNFFLATTPDAKKLLVELVEAKS
jgi:hypothetical protein